MRIEEPQLDVAVTQATHYVIVRNNWQKHVLIFLMVFGLGLIVMMATMGVSPDVSGFRVIHPLDDVAEHKCSTAGIGEIRMTRAVRVSVVLCGPT